MTSYDRLMTSMPPAIETSSLVPAAQYLRMSTDLQQYSIDNQTVAISRYATENNLDIVRTYIDADKTGLVIAGRDGLTKLLSDVESPCPPFKVIVVYDITRWGRFQDTDESAYYEFRCRKMGVDVRYCAEPFINDGSMPSLVMKSLKRIMAAEFSRELSNKVFEGMRAMVGRGLWTGANPGYGLRRLLVSRDGTPKQLLNKFERKNIKSDRTVLVPGPEDEIKVVRDVYHMFIAKKMSAEQIANELNRRHITHDEKQWNHQAILKILTHEKYTGSLVWGRWTQKLRTRCVPVPRKDWIVVPNVITPIVSRKTFDAAQRVLRDRTANRSDAQVLDAVRKLLKRERRLSARIINKSRTTPCLQICCRRFGSLRRLYSLVGYERKDFLRTRRHTRRQITSLYKVVFRKLKKTFGRDIKALHAVDGRPSIVKFSSGLKVRILVCPSLSNRRWLLRRIPVGYAGLVSLLCRCHGTNRSLYDYHVLPNLLNMPKDGILKENDQRLKTGEKLVRIRDLRELAHRFASLRPEAFQLEGWDDIACFMQASKSAVKRWADAGMPVGKRGHYVTASPEKLTLWRSLRRSRRLPSETNSVSARRRNTQISHLGSEFS